MPRSSPLGSDSPHSGLPRSSPLG